MIPLQTQASDIALPNLGIHHFSIAVPDIEAAIQWYGSIFGFEAQRRFQIDSIQAKGAFLKRDGLRIELWQVGDGSRVPDERKQPNTDLRTGGTKHVAFAVTDLQACLSELVRRGVDIASVQRNPGEPMRHEQDPSAITDPPAFAAFIRDPGGTLIELLDARRLEGLGSL